MSLSFRTSRTPLAWALLALAGCGSVTDTGPTPDLPTTAGAPTSAVGGASLNLAALYTGYDSAHSAHFAHLRTQMSDYRIVYQDASARATEFAWSARHFDRIILDSGDPVSVSEYRRLNPTGELYRYAFDWSVIQPGQELGSLATAYYDDMQRWYAAHPEYQLERAFLHDLGQCGASVSAACRIGVRIWTQMRWVLNPGDAGLRAYQRDRLARIAADVDGLFIDEHSSGDFDGTVGAVEVVEYPDYAVFQQDIVGLLRDIRAGLGGKKLLINSFNYVRPWDQQMIAAAGGTHAEQFNNPVFPEMESRWSHVETVLAGGATMNMPTGGSIPTGYTAGNFGSPTERKRMWELASYYLVAPSTPGALLLNAIGDRWDVPFADNWLRAAEANVGLPAAARQVRAEGTDGAGRHYRVWSRDLERALVLVRPVIEWGTQTYGDETGVSIALPAGESYFPLRADGSLDAAVDHVVLRAGEGAVLIKGSQVRGLMPAPVDAPVLLVLDQDAIDNNTAPFWFTAEAVNDDIARVGQRQVLRWFRWRAGQPFTLYSGAVGAEGFFALRAVPPAWSAAGPTSDGLRNFVVAGPGLTGAGGASSLLASVAGATPLRATGLRMLIGRSVCAVVLDNQAWVTSYQPIASAFEGPTLGVVAFQVTGLAPFPNKWQPTKLPVVQVTILDADRVCAGPLATLPGAPAPTDPRTPMDVTP